MSCSVPAWVGRTRVCLESCCLVGLMARTRLLSAMLMEMTAWWAMVLISSGWGSIGDGVVAGGGGGACDCGRRSYIFN